MKRKFLIFLAMNYKNKIKTLKHKAIDYYHLIFKSAHHNYYRVESLKEDAEGGVHLGLYFRSYTDLVRFQKKIRKLSLGIGTIIVATIISTLTLNLSTGPIGDSMAANYGWQQSDWNTENLATTDIHEDALDGSTDHTVYSSKDAGTVAGTNLSVSKTSTNWNEDNTFDTYTSADSNLSVTGGGITLLKPNGAICSLGTECESSYCCVVCGPNDGSCNACTPCGNSCTYEGFTYYTVLVGTKCWFQNNLGTSNVATAQNDSSAYGGFYQWGRRTDGHQSSYTIIDGPVSTLTPGSVFVRATSAGYNWYTVNDSTLWNSPNYTNTPCPPGWHVPTKTEIGNAYSSENIIDNQSAFNSKLKLPSTGYKNRLGSHGNGGPYLWTSDASTSYSYYVYLNSGVKFVNESRAYGLSVRCIKNSL